MRPARHNLPRGTTCKVPSTHRVYVPRGGDHAAQTYQLSGGMLYLPGNTHTKTDKILIIFVCNLSDAAFKGSTWPACAR